MSISIRYKTIPSLTSPICLRFIWFHLTLTVIIFLPFSKEKSKQYYLGAHIAREDGIKKVLKHWNNQGEGSKLMSGEQRDYSCVLLSGHLCLEHFPSSSQLWWGSQTSAMFTKDQYGWDGWQKVLGVKQLFSITTASWRRGGILNAEEKSNTDFHQEQNILICYKKEKKKKSSLAISAKWWPSVLFNPP